MDVKEGELAEMEIELRLRIVLVFPPSGVDFGVQDGKGSDYTTIQQHHLGEGGTSVQGLSGHVALGPPRFDGGGSDATPDWSG